MAPPPSPPASGPDVVAAGAVVARKGPQGREVLLVHRPKYDDWSFPKGKQDPGEHVTATATREVLEETGVEIRLGRPLRPQMYVVSGGRAKTVHYWVGHVVGEDDVSGYLVNDEVDDLGWFGPDEARERLTYLDDMDLLDQWAQEPRKSSAVVVVRHAKAVKRGDWSGEDPARPLSELGQEQARTLVPLLHAYGVVHVVTSSSARCTQTLAPYAEEQVLALEQLAELSEEGHSLAAVSTVVHHVLDSAQSTVLCSHRPVLPQVFEVLGVEQEPLSPAELVVCHHRNGVLVGVERHYGN